MVEKLLGNLRVLPHRVFSHPLTLAVLLRKQVDSERFPVGFGDFSHVRIRPEVRDHVILGCVELGDSAGFQVLAAHDVFIHESQQSRRAAIIDQANRSQLVEDVVFGFIQPL
nr:hypothetical protein [Rosistilla oblonga]